ncbi:hypothetical protein [Mammaliicoccus sciuri]|uniref:hypothetical protein n=1 Tax=Mammaliicoccus sciuri TaxID=1296 RepID=UPI0034DD8BCB
MDSPIIKGHFLSIHSKTYPTLSLTSDNPQSYLALNDRLLTIEGIELGARRIGHGVAAIQDNQALSYIKQHNALLEICPTSNLQTKAIQSVEELNIRKLIEQGIPFNINTDNRTVSNTNLNQEYQLLYNHQLLSIAEMKDINIKAIDHAFISDIEKEQLKMKY